VTSARVMTCEEQKLHASNIGNVRLALSALRLTQLRDEDVRVAKARLSNWLAENDERWTK